MADPIRITTIPMVGFPDKWTHRQREAFLDRWFVNYETLFNLHYERYKGRGLPMIVEFSRMYPNHYQITFEEAFIIPKRDL